MLSWFRYLFCMKENDERRHEKNLAEAIQCLARSIGDLAFKIGSGDNNAILQRLAQVESNILMKLSEVKTAVAEAAADSTEAFTELATRIADLDKQIADLVAAATDPDVTDEKFLADLTTVKTNSAALKNIVSTPAP